MKKIISSISFYECYEKLLEFQKVLTGKSAHWPAH